jgi:hypothetical protein
VLGCSEPAIRATQCWTKQREPATNLYLHTCLYVEMNEKWSLELGWSWFLVTDKLMKLEFKKRKPLRFMPSIQKTWLYYIKEWNLEFCCIRDFHHLFLEGLIKLPLSPPLYTYLYVPTCLHVEKWMKWSLELWN